MGLFRRKEREYTLGEAMKLLATEKYANFMPVEVEPGKPETKYWLREEQREKEPNAIKRNSFLDELSGNGEYRKLDNGRIVSASNKPGRVVTDNNYKNE